MIGYIFTSLALFFISIVLLSMMSMGWRLARQRFHTKVVVDLIFFFVFVKLVLYYFLPTLMRILSDYQFVRADRVALVDLVFLYIIELISWTIWLVALLSIMGVVAKGKKKLTIEGFAFRRHTESKSILGVLALGFCTTKITPLIGIETSPYLEVFKSLFAYAGVVTGPFLLMLSLRFYGKPFFFLGIITTLIALLSFSTRGVLVYQLLFLIFLAFFVLRSKMAKNIICGAGLGLVIIYFIFGTLISGSFYINDSGNVRISTNISAISTIKKGIRSSIEEIEWRFGASTRLGTAFINLYDRGEAAGFNPIKHSLMGFLPRSINPDKPIPSTLVPDDIYSQGMYIIQREIHGPSSRSMVEFPTGAHFYWEFGLIGVFILSAISGLYIALCAQYFSKLGFVAFPLIVAVFKPWGYVDPKIWVSDIAMQIYQILLPLILLVLIIRSIRYGLKFIRKSLVYLCANHESSSDDVLPILR
jgi:hypothetical protein